MYSEVDEFILDDVGRNQRSFLPGQVPTLEELRGNLDGSVQFDGLSSEERSLLLSILPAGSGAVFLSAMDKGLSGSRVVSARYRVNGGWSKVFVAKIGESSKIEREVDAMQRLVSPTIRGIEPPVHRHGPSLSLIAQELRGLTPTEEPMSLRLFLRNTDRGGEAIERLLRVRLGPWYAPERPREQVPLRTIFASYLRKAPAAIDLVTPPEWSSLSEWVQSEMEADLVGQEEFDSLLDRSISTKMSIVHGDLHSQNVLVDEENLECWPIDFAWCREARSPLVDMVMLECSIKFLAIPMRADLRSLLTIESALLAEPYPRVASTTVPFAKEIGRCVLAVHAIRRYALGPALGFTFAEYRAALAVMSYALSNHLGLNRPFVMAAVQLAARAALSERENIDED